MNHIGDLFSKVKGAFANSNRQKEVVAVTYKKLIGVDISSEQIEIDRNILKLNVSPAAKSVVFMKKQVLLEELNKEIKPALTDIR